MPLLAGRDFTRGRRVSPRRRSRSSTRRSRRSSTSGATRSASGWATTGRTAPLTIEIVGIVRDAKYARSSRRCRRCSSRRAARTRRIGQIDLLRADRRRIREQFMPNIPKVLARLDPNLPVRESADAAAAGARERVPRSVHQRAVGVVRVCSRRCSRRSGSTACWRLHGVAADARDRAADGARRGAVAGACDGAAAGRRDGRSSADRSDWRRAIGLGTSRSRCVLPDAGLRRHRSRHRCADVDARRHLAAGFIRRTAPRRWIR